MRSLTALPLLELQAAFASCIGQGFNAPNIAITAAVEYNLLDAFCPGALGERLAHQAGLLGLLQTIHLAPQLMVQAGGRNEGTPGLIVNHLGVDFRQAAENIQARTCRGTGDRLAHPKVAPDASEGTRFISSHMPTPYQSC